MTDIRVLYVSSNTVRSILAMLFTVLIFKASGQQGTNDLWYADKLLRIYHPNMRNWEVEGLNVAKFVEECAAVNPEMAREINIWSKKN